MDIHIKALTIGERALTMTWSDGRASTYHYFWLRDNCPQLRHPSTNHRVVETSSLPADVRPASAEITAGWRVKDRLAARWPRESLCPCLAARL